MAELTRKQIEAWRRDAREYDWQFRALCDLAIRGLESPPPQMPSRSGDSGLTGSRSAAAGVLVKRLRAPMWQVEPIDIQRIADEAADLIERLVREKEAAERDAARYRWLRANVNAVLFCQYMNYGPNEVELWSKPESIDSAIDEALYK